MSGRKLIVLYLIVAILVLRFAGVHVHLHNHALAASHDTAHLVQFGDGDDHGAQHNQDVDVDMLDASFTKKPDFEAGQPLLLAMLLLLILNLGGTFLPLLPSTRAPGLPGLRYRLPPATAPPA